MEKKELPIEPLKLPPVCFDTRNLFELTVGQQNRRNPIVVEVLVFLRQEDVSWWNSNGKEHQNQLFHIISRRILPTEFTTEEIWSNGRSGRHQRRREKMKQQQQQQHIREQMFGKRAHEETKREEIDGSEGIKLKENVPDDGVIDDEEIQSKRTKKGSNVASSNASEGNDSIQKKESPKSAQPQNVGGNAFKMAFGNTIQASYQLESLKFSEGTTLIMNNSSEGDNDDLATNNEPASFPSVQKRPKSLATFQCVRKLPKRILLWCYPFDSSNPTAPHPMSDGGFPRPDLIPLSSLFAGQT